MTAFLRRALPGNEHGDGRDGDLEDGAREWLVTNGLGGYASGTVTGAVTRRFHGLLIASLEPPLGRTMMLNHLAEIVRRPGAPALRLDAQKHPVSGESLACARIVAFSLDDGLPVWRYELAPGVVLEKSLVMPHRQNTVHVRYRLVEGAEPVEIELSPWVNFRPHEGALDRALAEPYTFKVTEEQYEISAVGEFPPLRLCVKGDNLVFSLVSEHIRGVSYGIEKSRGYEAEGDLYTPGFFSLRLNGGGAASITASTEAWNVVGAMNADEAFELERMRHARLLASAAPGLREGVPAELILAADQFVITAMGRIANRARSHALGDEIRTVIAGYHWFTDWGRDTMISLEGLTLVTGRFAEARYILRTFSHYVRNGLIPNNFPEGNNAGVYYTADATLWFFHAIDRYVAVTGDETMVESLLPLLVSILDEHLKGTLFGIAADPRDGLLRQGSPDHPLTWMDAKVGDLIVTPRRGKAVEINALYYNALCLVSAWARRFGGAGSGGDFAEQAAKVRSSFNSRFWNEKGGYLFDIVDGESGDDAAFRPNQLLALSLPNAVLDPSRWEPVVTKVEERLLTPVGLRSLAPGDRDYKGRYFGNLHARDLAYHQGTVWAWLIGPFVDAWLKVHPHDIAGARRFLGGFTKHLDEACVGSISEIFDAELPHTPRGCVAQAWSVAEVLRLYGRLAEGKGERG